MNLLAFALHTLLDLADADYQLIRGQVGARRTFFEQLRALTTDLAFANWIAAGGFHEARLGTRPALAKS